MGTYANGIKSCGCNKTLYTSIRQVWRKITFSKNQLWPEYKGTPVHD